MSEKKGQIDPDTLPLLDINDIIIDDKITFPLIVKWFENKKEKISQVRYRRIKISQSTELLKLVKELDNRESKDDTFLYERKLVKLLSANPDFSELSLDKMLDCDLKFIREYAKKLQEEIGKSDFL